MGKTCFVIMPIGNQKYGDIEISAAELRSKYDDLIKEAIRNARSGLDIIRSDDVTLPGAITTDILMRLMHSDYIVADITYPNPNVYYELGIRHACRPRTILIKERINFDMPFDIYNLRYIEYENSTTGLKKLSVDLKNAFDYLDKNPNHLDNQVLELASLIKYKFLKFDNEEENEKNKQTSMINAFVKLIGNPNLVELFTNKEITEEQRNALLLQEMSKSPECAAVVLQLFADLGCLKPDLILQPQKKRIVKGR